MFCEWAARSDVDPVQIKHICERSRIARTDPVDYAVQEGLRRAVMLGSIARKGGCCG
jgi:hypothetical protein